MKKKLIIKPNQEYRDQSEFAAWYTLYALEPKEYSIETNQHGEYVLLEASVIQDYYQSFYGGVALGKPYDIYQNAGKKAKVSMSVDRVVANQFGYVVEGA